MLALLALLRRWAATSICIAIARAVSIAFAVAMADTAPRAVLPHCGLRTHCSGVHTVGGAVRLRADLV